MNKFQKKISIQTKKKPKLKSCLRFICIKHCLVVKLRRSKKKLEEALNGIN